MPDIRQSTAVTILIGPFLNSTDGVSLMTALEVSIGTAVDIFRDATKVDITTSAAGTNAMAHVAGGMYSLAFVASQITACTIFTLEAIFASCLPVWHVYDVLEEDEYDRKYTSTSATVGQVKTDTTSIAISVTSMLTNYAQASTIIGVAQASVLTNVFAGTTSIAINVTSALANINLWGASTAISTASILSNVLLYGASTMIGITSALVNINLWGTSTMIGVSSILTNYAQASTIIGVAQASALSAVKVSADNNGNAIEVLRINDVSTSISIYSVLSNVKLYGASNAIAVASVNSNVLLYGASTMIGINSALTNINLWGTSTMIGVSSLLTNVGLLNDLSAADINAEVLDVLNVDTFAEPGQEAPGATVSLARKIGYLYKQFRNRKTVTSTAISIYADNATTVDQTLTHSDDGNTYDKGEVGSGP
jgi:hypothetical protein